MEKNTKANVVNLPLLSNGNPLSDKDGNPLTVQFDLCEPSKSIGSLLEKLPAGSEIRLLGSTVKIPTGSYTQQFNAITQHIVDTAFEGCEPTDKPKTKEALTVITGLNGKIHFEQPTCAQVKEALRIRKANFTQSNKWERNKTRLKKENVVIMAETEVLKGANKAAKEGGRPAVLAYIQSLTGTQVKAIGGITK